MSHSTHVGFRGPPPVNSCTASGKFASPVCTLRAVQSVFVTAPLPSLARGVGRDRIRAPIRLDLVICDGGRLELWASLAVGVGHNEHAVSTVRSPDFSSG